MRETLVVKGLTPHFVANPILTILSTFMNRNAFEHSDTRKYTYVLFDLAKIKSLNIFYEVRLQALKKYLYSRTNWIQKILRSF